MMSYINEPPKPRGATIAAAARHVRATFGIRDAINLHQKEVEKAAKAVYSSLPGTQGFSESQENYRVAKQALTELEMYTETVGQGGHATHRGGQGHAMHPSRGVRRPMTTR